MKLNFQGRVSNIVLPLNRALLPLFEAIMNSFHALEDAGRKDGFIKIYVHRNTRQERQPLLIGEGLTSRTILGFTVEDNGIGFTQANYDSFETSDSDHKRARGAKGVGRFMWLKAFEAVRITSVFRNNGSFKQRSFDFSLKTDGIANVDLSEVESSDSKTLIELKKFNDRYEQECPRTAETIAERIIEHCLCHFMSPNCPDVYIQDEDEKAPIHLNELYRQEIQAQTKHTQIKCGNVDLSINHVKVFACEFSQHTIHLCANGRDVQHISLKAQVPYVPSKFKAAQGKSFVYKAYVSSPFLDQRVNAERTAFNLSRDGEMLSQHEPTEDQLVKAIVQASEIELGPLLGEVEERIKQRIEKLVGSKYPEYRPLLKEVDTYLREFREDAEEKDILTKLNDIQFREDLNAREKAKGILTEKDEGVRNSTKYKQLQDEYLKKANEIAQSRLAQCVIHRRIILDLLESQVGACKDGKFPKEEKIHEIIFPMRKTSDEVSSDKQNLWIVDERLAFHRFLASDKPIKTFSTNNDAKDEPDLFILNHPGVFVASEDRPVNSAVIVEFKRAERDDLKENPIQQVLRYVKKLQGQEIKDSRSRAVRVHSHAIFYCYIIADLTDTLRAMAEESGLDPTPDQIGYAGFNRNYRAYIEVISYEKLLKDSNERNRELFKSLGLGV